LRERERERDGISNTLNTTRSNFSRPNWDIFGRPRYAAGGFDARATKRVQS